MPEEKKSPKTFQNGDLEDEGGTAPTDPTVKKTPTGKIEKKPFNKKDGL
jgi:hypothetical protein